jgi:hypothetical protein
LFSPIPKPPCSQSSDSGNAAAARSSAYSGAIGFGYFDSFPLFFMKVFQWFTITKEMSPI